MLPETTAGISAFDMCRVILEVEKSPELKAGIGDRELDPVVARLLAGVRKVRMLIHVEHAPDFVIRQELVPPALRVALGLPFPRRRSLHEGLWDTALVVDLDYHQGIAEGCAEVLEIPGLGDAAFADDKDASLRFPSGNTAPKILGTSPFSSTHLHRLRLMQ